MTADHRVTWIIDFEAKSSHYFLFIVRFNAIDAIITCCLYHLCEVFVFEWEVRTH